MRRALNYFGEYRDWQMIAFAGVLGVVVALTLMGIIDAYSVSPSAVSLTLAAVVGAFGICIVGSMSAWRKAAFASTVTAGTSVDFVGLA